jgi:hypothetical protein
MPQRSNGIAALLTKAQVSAVEFASQAIRKASEIGWKWLGPKLTPAGIAAHSVSHQSAAKV